MQAERVPSHADLHLPLEILNVTNVEEVYIDERWWHMFLPQSEIIISWHRFQICEYLFILWDAATIFLLKNFYNRCVGCVVTSQLVWFNYIVNIEVYWCFYSKRGNHEYVNVTDCIPSLITTESVIDY